MSWLRWLLAAVALTTLLLLTIASFYWAVSEGGVAVAAFAALALTLVSLIALSPWSSEGEPR
ncbi:MAG: hypothetical protein QXT74_02830 [Candidatus Nezhaarchaeales archaeon]